MKNFGPLIFLVVSLLCLAHARAEFSFIPDESHVSSTDEMKWYLGDESGKKIVAIINAQGSPTLVKTRKSRAKNFQLWLVEYSTAPMGTSTLTQIDYMVFLKENLQSPGTFEHVATEAIRLTRYRSGRSIYKKNRVLKTDLGHQRILLGELDEFSAKTIQIR